MGAEAETGTSGVSGKVAVAVVGPSEEGTLMGALGTLAVAGIESLAFAAAASPAGVAAPAVAPAVGLRGCLSGGGVYVKFSGSMLNLHVGHVV